MSVDLSQFHQVFIEESIEGLDVMESALMDLDPDAVDNETINAIFRAAHSIKGGGATFGFTAIAEFTHVLETLLDQVRSGLRGVDADDVNLLLQSVDCMREMLALLQGNQNTVTESSERLKKQFEALLNSTDTQAQADKTTPSNAAFANSGTWEIIFRPGLDIMTTGNDPARIFKSLSDLGRIQVKLLDFGYPDFAQINPEYLYLAWCITITGSVTQEQLEEQFEWVSDESDLQIKLIDNASDTKKVVSFRPNESIFLSGNEPSKILKRLCSLDPTVKISCEHKQVPALKLLDSELCFLSWQVTLSASISDEAINEVFEWVDDQFNIVVQSGTVDSVGPPPKLVARAVTIPESKVVSLEGPQVAITSKSKGLESPAKKAVQSESSSIRVGIDKIDNLINMVGELVITQSMLGQLGTEFDLNKTPKLIEGLSQLEQNTRELQESVMRIRMLPISFAFSRFPRMVRDLGQQLGKKIHLEMLGEQTELDKTVMEKIGDPLVHLVRNAVDHGIEPAAQRVAAGKPEVGRITLNAYHQGGNVVIEIVDDGKGLDRQLIIQKALDRGIIGEADRDNMTDEQVFDLIFQPGFSTAQTVSDVSGRGVGMDVVKRNIQSLNGVVEIQSKKGEGSKIRIRLPLTLAILDGQLVRVGGSIYIFPLVSIVESMQSRSDLINHIAGNRSVFRLRDDYVPIVRLNQVFGIDAQFEDLDQALMVVVESDGEKIGVVVDELLAQQQVVIKSLEQNYHRIEGVSGATILGDGTVALIVDIPGVVKLAGTQGAHHYGINAKAGFVPESHSVRQQA